MDVHDHEYFPTADAYWMSLGFAQRQMTCPKVGNAYGNAYVFNNYLAGITLADVEQPELTVVSADGKHDGDAWLKTYDNVAYQPDDLQRRHGEKFVASYVDGHVDLTANIFFMSGKLGRPDILHWQDTMLWLAADRDAQYDPATKSMATWGDGSWQGLPVTPLDLKHPPTYRTSVPSLGGKPAIFFHPPVSNPNILVTDDISGGWCGNEGTIFIVFQPTGYNAQCEYTVLDQSNGDTVQATRLRFAGGSGSSSSGNSSLSANASGGGGNKSPKVSISATPTSISAGQSVVVQWSSSDAASVVSSSFGATGVCGSLTCSPTTTTTYFITVANTCKTKTASSSVTVTVNGVDQFAGNISWLRSSATVKYPPNNVPYDAPTLWTLVSKGSSYTVYDKGNPWPAYAGGADWLLPARCYIGGTKHGTNANRRSFDGYVAEIIIYRTALEDADRQTIEKYLLTKYDL
jgi:prepilin-type processing-associated H-X9-DG protein